MLSNRHTPRSRTPGAWPFILAFGLLLLCLTSLLLSHPQRSSAQAPNNQKPPSKADTQLKPPGRSQTGRALPYETAPEPRTLSPDRQGGPDAYGYTFSDNRDPGGPVYTWQPGSQRIADTAWQIVRGTDPTQPWDDGVVTYTLPFAFNLYGTNYNVVHVSTNGNIHFGAPNDYWPQKSGLCIPANNPYVPKAMIAPLWYDFVASPVSGTVQGGVYTDILGTAPNRTYLVEWRNVYTFQAANIRATFEVLLKENGDIIYQYNAFNGGGVTGSQAVVGIQNATGDIGLPYICYQDDLTPERAIRYRLQQAVFLLPGDRVGGGAPGASVTYTETVLNQTGIDNSFALTVTGQTWNTTVEPLNTGTIPGGGSAQVTVHVDIPSGTPLGSRDVTTLTASSTLPSPSTYTDTVVLTTTASTLGVDFTPPAQTQAGSYGAPVTYRASLTNRSGQTNSFQLGLDGADWATTITPTMTADIAPDSSVPVTVSVLVPANASLGASDVVTVTATGQQPSPGQFYGVTVLTTTAGIWERKNNMPLPRSRGAAVAFPPNGRIYIIGGEYNNGSTNLPVEEYDPVSDTWVDRASLQTGVSNVGAAAIGNAIYIPGGYSSTQPAGTRTTMQVFYPLENRVDTIATDPLPTPRFGAGVAAYNGKLYLIGGSDDTLAARNTVYEYDPARPAGSRWQARAPMPTARIYLGAATVDGIIYAAGGVPGALTDLATVEAFDPATNSWTTRQPMSRARGGVSIVGVDTSQPGCGGYLYALGGGWINYTASAERYNPSTNNWELVSSLLAARRTLQAAYSPSTYSLVAAGGWDGTYQSRTEAIRCSGSLVPPTMTPTVAPTGTPQGSCNLQFSDVPEGSTFYPFVRCLACRGIINGYTDGTFRPFNNITRGQLSKILSNSADYNDTIPATQQTFSDVPSTDTFWLYIERIAAHGAISGYAGNGTTINPCTGLVEQSGQSYFRSCNNATRGQIAKIDAEAAGYNEVIAPTQQTFADVPTSNAFWVYIERIALHGVIAGYSGDGVTVNPCTSLVEQSGQSYFRWCNNATRGQTSKIVANTFFPECTPTR